MQWIKCCQVCSICFSLAISFALGVTMIPLKNMHYSHVREKEFVQLEIVFFSFFKNVSITVPAEQRKS